jgi:hypothetical protein
MTQIIATVVYGFQGHIQTITGWFPISLSYTKVHAEDIADWRNDVELATTYAIGEARTIARSTCEMVVESAWAGNQPMPNGTAMSEYIKAMCEVMSISTMYVP